MRTALCPHVVLGRLLPAVGSVLILCTLASVAHAAPVITDVSPSSGAVAAAVIVTGTDFGTTSGTVRFNGIAASVVSWTPTSLRVAVPSGATSGGLTIEVGGVSSNAVPFTVAPTPHIAAINPASSVTGGLVVVSGANFGASQGLGSVRFGDQGATVNAWSDTSVTVTVPARAGGDVVLRVNGANSNRVPFAVLTTLLDVTGRAEAARVGYAGGVDATFRKPRLGSSTPHVLQVQFAWYRQDGQLFAVEEFFLPGTGGTTSGLHGTALAHTAPPWRVRVTLREMDATLPATLMPATCNSDRPYPGQAACASDTLATPLGTVLAETSAEVTIAAVN